MLDKCPLCDDVILKLVDAEVANKLPDLAIVQCASGHILAQSDSSLVATIDVSTREVYCIGEIDDIGKQRIGQLAANLVSLLRAHGLIAHSVPKVISIRLTDSEYIEFRTCK